jgi:hypothetical protein
VSAGLARERGFDARALDAIIVGDERLSAIDRVGIYANAYFFRLLDVLREDFPCVATVLGDAVFHNLVTGYLIEYPPDRASVVECGRYFADHVGGHPIARKFPFLADLAGLERASVEIFLAPDAATLTIEDLRAIEPSRWASIRLKAVPAARVLEHRWPASKLAAEIERGRKFKSPSRRANSVLVWRRDNSVRRREVAGPERAAIAAMIRGSTFGRICTIVARAAAAKDPAKAAAAMLANWVADKLLVAPSVATAKAARRVTRRRASG